MRSPVLVRVGVATAALGAIASCSLADLDPLSSGSSATSSTASSAGATTSATGSSTGSTSSNGGAGGAGGAGGGPVGCAPIGDTETIACNQSNPSAVALGATEVFWANEDAGTVVGAPKAGGEATTLSADQDRPCGMASRGTRLAWRNRGGEVRLLDLDVGGAEVIATAQGDSCAVALDDVAVYWHRMGEPGPGLMRFEIASGSSKKISAALKPAALDASDPTAVFWSDSSHGKLVKNEKSDVDQPFPFAGIAVGDIRGISVDPTHLYAASVGSPANAVIRRIDRASVSSVLDIAWLNEHPRGLVRRNARLYWALRQAGIVQQAEVSAPPNVQTIAAGLGQVCALAVDAQHVYFSTCSGGTVGRFLRPQ